MLVPNIDREPNRSERDVGLGLEVPLAGVGGRGNVP